MNTFLRRVQERNGRLNDCDLNVAMHLRAVPLVQNHLDVLLGGLTNQQANDLLVGGHLRAQITYEH